MRCARACLPLCLLALAGLSASPARGELIDDFEDGIINPTLWTARGGNYGGGPGWGSVTEQGGALMLQCQDTQRYGAGVSCVILRRSIVDMPVYFSFDCTIYDDTLDGRYVPVVDFRLTGRDTANAPTGLEPPRTYVYQIRHDQRQQTNHVSGVYYYFVDSAAREARLYNAAGNTLLGTASWADFGSLPPYIAFDAYADTDNGTIINTLALHEIWYEVPEPTALLLFLAGLGLAMRR
ncbi:MAG: PEP-CTERM sorting domain-containing protein [Planctomycetota bacterium]